MRLGHAVPAALAALALVGCGGSRNAYVPPPPPKVVVARPCKRPVTLYFELTGNTQAFNSVDLVARVQGYLDSIDYKDGAFVTKGTQLFGIERDVYQAQLDQAKAALETAQATHAYNTAEYQRQSTLGRQDFASQATVQQWKSNVDQAAGSVANAKAQIELAEINLGYTKVLAPFDGVISNHLVDVGALVGVSGPTKLATIVQTDPIYVYFNLSEPQVLAIKESNAKVGLPFRTTDLSSIPVEIGLQGEEGYPHKGHMDYAAPQVDPSTGTLTVRAVLDNKDYTLLPGLFARVRTPIAHKDKALLISNAAIGTSQEGSYALVVGADNVVQRKVVKTGDRQGQLRIIEFWARTFRLGGDRRNSARFSRSQGRAAANRAIGKRGRFIRRRHADCSGSCAKMTPREIDPPNRTPNESSGRAGAISRFFIERPVLANVLALVVVLVGLVALIQLPSAQYPNVVPPTVQVTTRYPGASARTLVDSVALPIEQNVNGVENMIYMQSTSADDGTYNLAVTFAIGTNPDLAQVLVQNRVAIALSSLPQEVQLQGVTTKKQSTSILEFVGLVSPDSRFDSLFLSNYAVINVQDELRRLNGVGDVTVLGAGQYAMRVWLNPDLLQSRGLTPQDVINVIQQQSQEVTAGQLGAPPAPKGQDFQYTLDLKGRLDDPSEFENIIVKVEPGPGGRITRVRDVGHVELGAQTYSESFELDGQPAAGIAISLLPDANAIAVSSEVKAKMDELAKSFPQGLAYVIPYDTTKFVRAAISEVYRTLIEAAILVLIVILVFLQDWRAMLVPATTVPVTLIGAFAAMAALGFSVNLPTLFALVLAIGIVVDDAIVIVEGVARYVEQGLPGREAAGRAMDDLTGPVLGITLVLMSVFIPAAFLAGFTGQLYRQFALVIAATALISAVNAMTLKPTQCALWLRPPKPAAQRNFFARGFDAVYGATERAYARLVGAMTRRAALMVVLAIALVGIAVYGLSRVPTAFLPTEDQGYLIVAVQLPDGASKERTDAVLKRVQEIGTNIPGVEHVVTVSGISILDNRASLANAGVAFVVLKDWDERLKQPGQDARSIGLRLNGALQGVPEAIAFALPPPPIQGIGNVGGFTMQVELKSGNFDYALLQSLTNAIVANSNAQSSLQRVATTFRAGAPQFFVTVDRVKAERIGVTVGQVFSALSGYVGAGYVAQFDKFGHVFQIYTQALPQYRATADDIKNLKVKAGDGTMTQIGTVVDVTEVQGPSLISLYNLYPSSTVVGSPAPGFSSGQALDIMDQIGKDTLPTGSGYDWTAMSFQEKQVGAQIYYVFGFALLLVYFVLAGQYESWVLPLAVILGVPLALFGPVLALTYLGATNVAASQAGVAATNLYTQIGLILLIALGAKNAILIVEYARQRRAEGMETIKAAVEGARLRFRPIIMTSFAFILGVLPLVLATGAGASARISIGIAVFYGMIASTCLVVVFVPSFYVVMQGIEEWRMRRGAPKNTAPISQAQTPVG